MIVAPDSLFFRSKMCVSWSINFLWDLNLNHIQLIMDSEEQESLLPPSQSRRNPPPDRQGFCFEESIAYLITCCTQREHSIFFVLLKHNIVIHVHAYALSHIAAYVSTKMLKNMPFLVMSNPHLCACENDFICLCQILWATFLKLHIILYLSYSKNDISADHIMYCLFILFWKTVFLNCRCHAVFVVFYFIGIGSLLPWNFFITANKVCILMTRYFLWISRSNKVSLVFFFSVFPVQTKEYHSSLGWWLH